MIYHRLPGTKDDYGKGAQTGVSFAGGYIAGILCAIVSHPADVMVSKLNADRQKGESFGGATSRIYKNIGFAGLWNGLPVRIVMIGMPSSSALLRFYPRLTTRTKCRNSNRLTMDDLRYVPLPLLHRQLLLLPQDPGSLARSRIMRKANSKSLTQTTSRSSWACPPREAAARRRRHSW